MCGFFFFKQKPAYEMRISDWSSDVCSSDLASGADDRPGSVQHKHPIVVGDGLIQGAIALQNEGVRCEPAIGAETVIDGDRSEERRVGKECVSTCRYRWSPDNLKK